MFSIRANRPPRGHRHREPSVESSRARNLIHAVEFAIRMADDHEIRMRRALASLDGLSVGDAFGQCIFSIALDEYAYDQRLTARLLPNYRWTYTDDTEMALG